MQATLTKPHRTLRPSAARGTRSTPHSSMEHQKDMSFHPLLVALIGAFARARLRSSEESTNESESKRRATRGVAFDVRSGGAISALLVLLSLLVLAPHADAQGRCRTRCRAGETADARGCCQPSAAVSQAPTCPSGQLSVAGGGCCYEGQVFADGRCRGVPSACPPTHVVDASNETCAVRPCEGGRVFASDGATCCWPGQVSVGGVCRGVPSACPAEHRRVPEREACEPLPACPANTTRVNGSELCCLPGQRDSQGRCAGTPTSCPSGQHPSAARETCVQDVQCSDGRVDGGDRETCCFPGQRAEQGRCIGVPSSCPAGQHPSVNEQACVADAVCPAGKELQQDRETCCFAGQTGAGGQCAGNRTCPAGLESRGDQCLRVDQHARVHIVGPIVLGLGAVMAAGAIPLWFEGDRMTNSLRADCARTCPSDWPRRAEAIRSNDLFTNVLLWGGGAVAITGAVLTAIVRNRWETRTPVMIGFLPGSAVISAQF